MGSALRPETVERIYAVRGRDLDKPLIVLVAGVADLGRFGISLSSEETAFLERWWPGKISVVLSCGDEEFRYLHRGTGSVAFRCPDVAELRELLEEAGPLVAPSANPQGLPPSETVEEAKRYFGDQVDFYVDGGRLSGEPSTLVKLKDGKVEVLRQGAVEIL
jgi:L-threonylcarbamoyladenylate synthase